MKNVLAWILLTLYLDPELVNAVSNQIGDEGVANNGHHNNDHIGDFHDVTANCLSRSRFTDAEFEDQSQQFSESCDCRLYMF